MGKLVIMLGSKRSNFKWDGGKNGKPNKNVHCGPPQTTNKTLPVRVCAPVPFPVTSSISLKRPISHHNFSYSTFTPHAIRERKWKVFFRERKRGGQCGILINGGKSRGKMTKKEREREIGKKNRGSF